MDSDKWCVKVGLLVNSLSGSIQPVSQTVSTQYSNMKYASTVNTANETQTDQVSVGQQDQ